MSCTSEGLFAHLDYIIWVTISPYKMRLSKSSFRFSKMQMGKIISHVFPLCEQLPCTTGKDVTL